MNKRPLVRLRSLRVMSGKNPESGVVLIVSLIMLLLLTLIGVTAMQTTSLEEKMAGNLRDKNLAFQAAESALRAAELIALMQTYKVAGTGGFYLDNKPTSPNPIPTAAAILTDSFWADATKPKATSTVTGLGNGIAPPVYIIQKLPVFIPWPSASPPVTVTPYKITVRATGGSTNTVAILQSIIYY